MARRAVATAASIALALAVAAAPSASQSGDPHHSLGRVIAWTTGASVLGGAVGYGIAAGITGRCEGACVGQYMALSVGGGLGFIIGQAIGLGAATDPHEPFSDAMFRRETMVWTTAAIAVGALGVRTQTRGLTGAGVLVECFGVSYAAYRFLKREHGRVRDRLRIRTDAWGRPQVVFTVPFGGSFMPWLTN